MPNTTPLTCRKKSTLLNKVQKLGGAATYKTGKNKGNSKSKRSLISWIRSHPNGAKKAKKAKK